MPATDDTATPAVKSPVGQQVTGVPGLIFVHGFLDEGSAWFEVAEQFRTKDFRTTIFDLPGMGSHSEDSGPFNLRRLTEALVEIIDAHDKPVVLVGHSMGTQIAELAAAARPDAVAGLFLLSPIPLAGVPLLDEIADTLRNLGGDPQGQRRLRKEFAPGLSPAKLDQVVETGMKIRPDTVRALFDAWSKGDPAGNAPSTFYGPIMLASGEEDGFSTPDLVKDVIAPRFPTAEIHFVEAAGHWPHVEKPEAVTSLLKAFLAKAELLVQVTTTTDWQAAFGSGSAQAFAAALAEDVVLEGSALYRPVEGREKVRLVMEAASRIYEHLEFTDQAVAGKMQFLQWKARAFGGTSISGVTVIERDSAGRIAKVAIHHRPLGAALMFSANLGELLEPLGGFDRYFMAQADWSEPRDFLQI